MEKAWDSFTKLFKWLEIRKKHGHKFPESLASLQIDAGKSALLRRLLENKPVYTFAPPLQYGYPWYSLIDEGEAGATDVWEVDDKKLCIEQAMWDIVSKTGNMMGDPIYFVTYPNVPGKFKIFLVENRGIVKIWKMEWLNPELKSVMEI